MDPRLDDYDWCEAFKYANGFNREDVAEIIGMDTGEDDGADWVIACRLVDGRFAMLRAWWDYTGWDCQAGGS